MRGVLNIIGQDPNNPDKILVTCSICSEDKELYPQPFSMFKSNFGRQTPCGCSKCPKLSEDQAYIVAKRATEALGYTFLGWSKEYTGSSSTKIRCVCPEHGEWNTGIISTIRKGVGCPKCVDPRKRKDLVKAEDFLATGFFEDGTTFTKSERKDKNGWSPYWFVTCPTCSNDKFVKAGLCSGIFEGMKSNLLKGAKPCRCSSRYVYTEEQYILRINTETPYSFIRWIGKFKGNRSKVVVFCEEHGGEIEMTVFGLLSGNRCITCHGHKPKPETDMKEQLKKVCEERGYTFVKLIDYKSNKSSFQYSCKTHGIQQISITNFIHGEQGCPECRGKNQTYAYIHLVEDEGLGIIGLKFGITKNPRIRIRQQNRLAKYKLHKFKLYRFETVAACRTAEKEVKDVLPCGVFSQQDIPDGWTETTYIYNLENIMKIFEDNGGILC